MSIKDLSKAYDEQAKKRKEKIKQEPKRFKRFLKTIWLWITFPFVWLWYNIRDWKTAIIFIIVFLLVSIEVWLPYLMGLITWGTDFSKWCFGIGSACWLFWIGPGTPFMVICIALTIGVKSLFNKIKEKRDKRKEP